MGAATSLMFVEMDQSVGGIVVDSAFASLRQLAGELSKMYMKRLPGVLVGAGLKIVGITIKKKAKFNISELRPIAHVKKAFVPALFIAAYDDNFINPKHTERLYKDYSGEKKLLMVDGDHNSVRPQEALDSIGIFFYNVLQCHQFNGQPKSIEFIQQFQNLGLTHQNNNAIKQQQQQQEEVNFEENDDDDDFNNYNDDDDFNNYNDDDDFNNNFDEDDNDWEDSDGFDQNQIQLAIQQSLRESKQKGNQTEDEEDFFSSIIAYSKNKDVNKNLDNQNNGITDDYDDIFDFFDNSKTKSTPNPNPTSNSQQMQQNKTTEESAIEDFFEFPSQEKEKQPQQQKQQKQKQQPITQTFDLLSLEDEEYKQTSFNDNFTESLI